MVSASITRYTLKCRCLTRHHESNDNYMLQYICICVTPTICIVFANNMYNTRCTTLKQYLVIILTIMVYVCFTQSYINHIVMRITILQQ